MKIKRAVFERVKEVLTKGEKGVVIYGPRQVGKTTLVQDALESMDVKALTISGDQRGEELGVLESRELGRIERMLAGYDLLFVDEAQRITEAGLAIKLVLDRIKRVRVVATGSSALDLASKIAEPLTGRVEVFRLLPISFGELSAFRTITELENDLEERLVFGAYPEIFSRNSREEKISYLQNLLDAYLYRDMLEFGGLKNPGKVRDLLRLLAFQIGNEVSLNELAGALEISKGTVDRYIELLEKSYVVFRMSGFNRNLRKEVTKKDKIYFYDLGVRNAVAGLFMGINARNDTGQLWENLMVVERMKLLNYMSRPYAHYFWRLTSGAELDLVEEREGKLYGYEFKYGKKRGKKPAAWAGSYPGAGFEEISRGNFEKFVLEV